MTRQLTRLTAAVGLAALLALPGSAIAADPAGSSPPAPVRAWQEHLDHMRTMGPNLGPHARECVEIHGSMAGLQGPNGMMTQGMGGMMGGAPQR